MQQQYRQYPQQAPQRSPHVGNPRARGAIGHPIMPPGPHMAQAQMNPAHIGPPQMVQTNAVEASRRRSRKPTDKTVPEGVEDIIIGDGVSRYRQLRDYERRLDATMTRKRLDMQDSVKTPHKRHKTLRVWVSNTVENQPWQVNPSGDENFDYSQAVASTYRVKIEGRLLDDDAGTDNEKEEGGADPMDTDAPSTVTTAAPTKQRVPPPVVPPRDQRPRFSHFFKFLSVVVDRSIDSNGSPEMIVEWKKPEGPGGGPKSSSNMSAASADFDEFTFKRAGDTNVNVTINLVRSEEPERYALSPALADVVDMMEATKSEVVARLWDYIRLMGLQEDEEKRNFRCDDLMRKVIGKEVGSIITLSDCVNAHIRPLPPISLPYTIRVDQEFYNNPEPTIYDLQVLVDEPLRGRVLPFLKNPHYVAMLREVATLDDELSLVIQALGQSKMKHTFYTAMHEDPANFMRNWLSSQQRDLEVIHGEAVRGGGKDASGEEWRRGGKNSIWNTENARESINLMLAKQPPPR